MPRAQARDEGLCPQMCGKALPFRQVSCLIHRGCASDCFSGGRASKERKFSLSERQSLSAHQAAKPQMPVDFPRNHACRHPRSHNHRQ